MSAGNLRRNLNNLGQEFRQSLTEKSALPATPAIWAFLGGSRSSFSNPGRQPCQFFQSQHAITLSRPATSVIPAISGDSLGNLGNLAIICILGNPSNLATHCNVARHAPSQSWQSLSTNSAFSSLPATPATSASLGGNLCSPGNPGRQFCQFCSIWAFNHPFSAGIIGNPSNLGRQSRQCRQSWKYLHSRHIQQSLQSLQCRPIISVAISTILARIFRNLGLKIRYSQQPRQSRHFWAAVSPVPANPSGNLVRFFNLSMQSSILVLQYRRSRQSRAKISAISAILPLSAFSSISAISEVSTISAHNLRLNLGSLCLKIRHSLHFQQPRRSRHFWAAVSAVTVIPSGTSSFFYVSACNHPFSAGNFGNPGNLRRQYRWSHNVRNICILGTTSNVGNLGTSERQSQQ